MPPFAGTTLPCTNHPSAELWRLIQESLGLAGGLGLEKEGSSCLRFEKARFQGCLVCELDVLLEVLVLEFFEHTQFLGRLELSASS